MFYFANDRWLKPLRIFFLHCFYFIQKWILINWFLMIFNDEVEFLKAKEFKGHSLVSFIKISLMLSFDLKPRPQGIGFVCFRVVNSISSSLRT